MFFLLCEQVEKTFLLLRRLYFTGVGGFSEEERKDACLDNQKTKIKNQIRYGKRDCYIDMSVIGGRITRRV